MSEQILEPDFMVHLQFNRLTRGALTSYDATSLDDMLVSDLDQMDVDDIDSKEIL